MKASGGAILLLSAKDTIFETGSNIITFCARYDESDRDFEKNKPAGRAVGRTGGGAFGAFGGSAVSCPRNVPKQDHEHYRAAAFDGIMLADLISFFRRREPLPAKAYPYLASYLELLRRSGSSYHGHDVKVHW